MAIFLAGATYVAPVVVDGVMLTVGAQAQPVAVPATTNRKRSRSRIYPGGVGNVPGFPAMDQLINVLDAQFDTLSNQAAWNAWAASIAGQWQLCANCQPDAAGKKLFRQLNFNRQLQGLGVLTVPPTATLPPLIEGIVLFLVPSSGFLQVDYYVFSGDTLVEVFVVPQLGSQLTNPVLPLPANNDQIYYPAGSKPYNDCLRLAPPIDGIYHSYTGCQFTSDGTPGLKCTVLFQNFG